MLPAGLLRRLRAEHLSEHQRPAPGFLHEYADHVQDWNAGDPDWFANGQAEQGRGIIGAINYLADFCGVNGMYMMLMNLGGDGKDTHPFFTNGGGMDCPMEGSDFDPSHTLNYHVTRMDQWRVVFEHASNKGVMLHLLLAEQEACNIRWFGAHDSNGGVRNHMGVYRRLYMKQMVAQFGHVLGIRWGLCEENKALQACTASGSCGNPATSMTPQFTAAELDEMARWIRAWDPYDHPISVHNVPNTLGLYEELLGLPTPPTWLSATSQQIHNEDGTGDGYEVQIRLAEMLFASVNYNLAIINDEQGSPSNGLASEFNFNANPTSTTDDRRRRVLYDVLLSGGQIAYYFGYYSPALGGGDLRCESFRTRGNALRQLGIARRLMEEHQIWRFIQRDNLIAGPTALTSYGRPEAAYREDGARFIVYYPGLRANSSALIETGRLDLRDWPNRAYKGRWLDPTTGLYLDNQSQLFLGGVRTPVFVPDIDDNGIAGDQISSKIDLMLIVEEIMSPAVGAALLTD